MTADEWRACTDLDEMLEFAIRRCKFSARKRGLFAIACCQTFADSLSPRFQRALARLELYLEGTGAGKSPPRKPYLSSMTILHDGTWQSDAQWAICKALNLDRNDRLTHGLMRTVSLYAARAVAKRPAAATPASNRSSSRRTEERRHRAVLRDLVVPFKRKIDPAWLVWDDRSVERLGRMIYKEASWGDLPILADALEDAGCDNADILNHLRGPGPHVRGCWVLDLLLNKA